MIDNIVKILGEEAQYLLAHKCDTISKDNLHLQGSDFVDRIFSISDRPNSVLRNLQTIFNHGCPYCREVTRGVGMDGERS